MPYLNGDLYNVLKHLNADDTLAQKAAESVTQLDRTDAKLTMLIWATGLMFAAMLAGFGAVFARLGALSAQLATLSGQIAALGA